MRLWQKRQQEKGLRGWKHHMMLKHDVPRLRLAQQLSMQNRDESIGERKHRLKLPALLLRWMGILAPARLPFDLRWEEQPLARQFIDAFLRRACLLHQCLFRELHLCTARGERAQQALFERQVHLYISMLGANLQ